LIRSSFPLSRILFCYILATVRQAAVLDVREFIDEQPFSGFQFLIAALCAMVVFIDGFDAQVMGPVGPSLMAQLHIARAAFGSVVSSGTLGMMVGALIFGPLADRFGRKPVLIACALSLGAGSLLTTTAASVTQLMAFRIFTGFGMGGAMPNAIALTSEYMPKRSRNAAVMVMFCGFSFGSAFAGWTVAALIRNYGWQSIFLVGGTIPIVVALLLIAFLPESIRFLVVKGGQKRRILKYLARIAPATLLPDEVIAGADEHSGSAFSVGQLFAEGRAAVTLMLWIMFFMNLLNLWFLNNWLPTIMNDAGIKVETASLITSLFQIGGLVGALALAGALGRRISFGILAITYLAAAIFIFLIGNAGASIPLLVMTVFASGMGVIGGQTVSNALTADFYPTAIRSTGIGWALGIGRVGSILGPILGGFLLSYGGSAHRVFWAAAAPALIATFAAAAVSLTNSKREV
jgi:AAHS family 4-hydroxybenzoate transporter-like MFS transporter